MNDIIDAIAQFTPENGDWLPLDRLLSEVTWGSLMPTDCQRLCLLFERYPEEDNEFLWGLLHRIESVHGCNEKVLLSVQRRPALMTVLMLNRMINAGQCLVAEVDLLEQIKSVSTDCRVSESIRKRANMLIDYQRRKTDGTTVRSFQCAEAHNESLC
jgi:hypothetical protein